MSGAWQAARLVIERDLRLAFRNRAQLLHPLLFFAIVTTLFPLALSPEPSRLRDVAPGVLWVAALLASLLAIEFLFRDDAQDGTLEQYALSGQSLTWLLFAKTLSHWLLTGLPLALMSPVAAYGLGVAVEAVPGIIASITLGTIALSLLGAVTAGLTLGIRRGGAMLSLLTLPLAVPLLIFGAQAFVELGLTLAPLAAAAAVRISLE